MEGLLFYTMSCARKLWGGSPATETLEAGVETEKVNKPG